MKTIFAVLLLLVGCSPKLTTVASLEGTWKLASINKEIINVNDYPNGIPELTFTTDDKVFGSTGCNRVSGSFTEEKKSRISFSPLVTTKMFCPGKGETTFLQALQSVNAYIIENRKLVLLTDEKETMVFVSTK